mgnify:FL=1
MCHFENFIKRFIEKNIMNILFATNLLLSLSEVIRIWQIEPCRPPLIFLFP